MRMTTIRRPLTALVAVAALLAAGCILSGQFVIVVGFGGIIDADDNLVGSVPIDLTKNSTWEEHADDIQNIIDVKFECKIENNVGTAVATGEVWVSPTSVGDSPEPADVRNHEGAVKFLADIEVQPGAERSISFKESAQYVRNLEEVLDMIKEGKFYIYGIAAEPSFNITVTGIGDRPHGRILVTFSAG